MPTAPDETPAKILSFRFLRDALWDRRRLVLAVTCAGLALGIAAAILLGGNYTVSMTVIPAESNAEEAGISSQLPSIFSNGTDIPVSKFKQFQASLTSVAVAHLMNQKYGTLCEINRARCDMTTRQWRPKPVWRQVASRLVTTLLGAPAKPDIPQDTDLAAYIEKTVRVVPEGRSSIVTLSMTSHDPQNAKLFLSRLVTITNQYVRDRDRADVRQYVAYLSDRLKHLDAVAQRASLDGLLQTEERRLMLTEVDVAYAATPLDGPSAVPTFAVVMIAAGTGIGFFLACVLTFAMKLWGSDISFRRRAVTFNGPIEFLRDA